MNRDIDDQTNDTEGHMPVKRGITEAGDDDAEGHASKPGKPRVRW